MAPNVPALATGRSTRFRKKLGSNIGKRAFAYGATSSSTSGLVS